MNSFRQDNKKMTFKFEHSFLLAVWLNTIVTFQFDHYFLFQF